MNDLRPAGGSNWQTSFGNSGNSNYKQNKINVKIINNVHYTFPCNKTTDSPNLPLPVLYNYSC